MATDDQQTAAKGNSWFRRPGSKDGSRPASSGGWSNGSSAKPGKRPSSSSGIFKLKEGILPLLASPQEGKELDTSSATSSWSSAHFSTPASPVPAPASLPGSPQPPPTSSGISLSRASTIDPTPPPSRPQTPRRWSNGFLLTYSPKPSTQNLDLNNSLDRTDSAAFVKSPDGLKSPSESTKSPTFSKSLPSILGLSSLSLSRTSTRDSANDDKDRGRSVFRLKGRKSSSQAPTEESESLSRSVSRARSQSPFSFRRFVRNRETSPTPPQAIPLSHSDADLSDTASSVAPRNSAFSDDDYGEETDSDEESESDKDFFDRETELNTEKNAIIQPFGDALTAGAEVEEPDPIGEGVNIIMAPEPYFPSTLNSDAGEIRGRRNPRKRKTLKTIEPLPFSTSRPHFQRDRCTITITQGEPGTKCEGRKRRRYVVASDLSEESRYAVEWGIGTVLRDGDEMLVVTVVENESKVDPEKANTADKSQKLRSQQERQGLAYILARQVTGLLQRTRLHVKISCQAWHAKNSRHMLLDIVDHVEPIMLVVGSRGLGHLNGILLGSTSHYLIQKCSVPVMVARRRLKRPPKKNAHLATHRAHVKLAEAGIDRVAAKVDEDVKVMRDEMQKDDNRRDGGPGSRKEMGGFTSGDGEADEEPEDDNDEEPAAIKVSG